MCRSYTHHSQFITHPMIPEIRDQFNNNFTERKYQDFLADLDSKHPGGIDFRVAETPVFVSKSFAKKMMDACEAIVDIITEPGFKKLTKNAIPDREKVANENEHTDFIAFDFGVCENEDGDLEPQLVEL